MEFCVPVNKKKTTLNVTRHVPSGLILNRAQSRDATRGVDEDTSFETRVKKIKALILNDFPEGIINVKERHSKNLQDIVLETNSVLDDSLQSVSSQHLSSLGGYKQEEELLLRVTPNQHQSKRNPSAQPARSFLPT